MRLGFGAVPGEHVVSALRCRTDVGFVFSAKNKRFRTGLMERIAGFGSNGRHQNRIHSQLLSLFCTEDLAGMVRPIQAGVVDHIVFPHELFSYIAAKREEAFELHLGATVAKVMAFWAKFLVTPYGQYRFPGKSPEDLQRCIPLVLHGDAAPYSRKQSALFAQWGSLLGSATYLKSLKRSFSSFCSCSFGAVLKCSHGFFVYHVAVVAAVQVTLEKIPLVTTAQNVEK